MAQQGYPAELYELVHRGTPGDLQFYEQVCVGAHRILELGCGYGRVLEHLRSPERTVVGLDLHEGLLQRARERLGPGVELHQGDMRDYDLSQTFDRILIPYCGLYCLVDDESVQACLRTAHKHLAPGGKIAMDAYVGELFLHAEPSEDHEAEMLNEVLTVDDGQHLWRVLERSNFEAQAQRLEVTYVHLADDGRPAVEGRIPQRFLLREQIQRHLDEAGFEIERFGEAFDAGPYDEDGDIWALVARRVG